VPKSGPFKNEGIHEPDKRMMRISDDNLETVFMGAIVGS
jgi:hypothetical protein